MSKECTLVVAVEDVSTATVVAAQAAHLAVAQGATKLVLLHVLDPHTLTGAAFAVSGYYVPVAETPAEGERLLALAEQVIQVECQAMNESTPHIEHAVREGKISTVIEQIIAEFQADGLVLGARRPHAFGRLIHPDVRSNLAAHIGIPIHVASLQAPPEVDAR